MTSVDEADDEEAKEVVVKIEPPYGTVSWLYYWSDVDGLLPSPINVTITNAIPYECPDLVWYNYDVYPHKIKVTNTGYTVLIGAKWKAERPYLEGGGLLGKHIFSQIHFHWGANWWEGSDHSVDSTFYPAEMQVTYFYSEYMTQEKALLHEDGVLVMCYIIKLSVEPDPRLQKIIDCLPRIREAQTFTKIGPYPLSQLMPMFYEDFFMYWGSLRSVDGQDHIVRWMVPRVAYFATADQIKEFRKMWDPWDEPNLRNFRPIQEQGDRHLFFIKPHWSQHNSLLPLPRSIPESISILSPEYTNKTWMLPPQNAYMIPAEEEEIEETPVEIPED